MTKSKRLGEMLFEAGLITLPQLERALDWQKARGGRLGVTLISMGVLTEPQLMTFLARKTGTRVQELDGISVPQKILDLIPLELVEKYNVVPLEMANARTLVVACADPTDVVCLDEIGFATGLRISAVISSFSEIVKTINRLYRGISVRDAETEDANSVAEDVDSKGVLKTRTHHKRLGEKLIEVGLITAKDLQYALNLQETLGGMIGENLIKIDAISELDLMRFLAQQSGLREVDLCRFPVSEKTLQYIPKHLVERFQIIPLEFKPPGILVVACADPTNLDALDQVAFVTGNKIEPVLASQTSIIEFIKDHYQQAIPVQKGEVRIIKDIESQKKAYFEGRRLDLDFGTPAPGDPDILIFDRSQGDEEEG